MAQESFKKGSYISTRPSTKLFTLAASQQKLEVFRPSSTKNDTNVEASFQLQEIKVGNGLDYSQQLPWK